MAGCPAYCKRGYLAIVVIIALFLGIVNHLAGHLREHQAAGLGQLGGGEVTRSLGAEADALDALGDGVLRQVLNTVGLDTCLEDGQVVNLHGNGVEVQLADAMHHVLQHACDGALAERRVVLRHVECQVVEVDGRVVGMSAACTTMFSMPCSVRA